MTTWPVCICAVLALVAPPAGAQDASLLANGGFEQHGGAGTVPAGWQALDELAGYDGWIAPRCERVLAGVLPCEGEWMAAVDTERMNVDTTGEDYDTPRAALYQTIAVPRGARGVFRIRYHDLGSSSGAWVSCLRLGYSIDTEEIGALVIEPETPGSGATGAWGRRLYKTAVENGGTGDWTEGRLAVHVPPGDGLARLTLWIGVFDGSSGDETGYWRVDDARFDLIQD